MNQNSGVTLGLDIGGTNLKAVSLELPTYRVLEEYELPSGAQINPEAVRKAIKETVSHFRKGEVVFKGVGIGCAGSVEPLTGIVRNSPNFQNWSNVPLKSWVEEDSGIPTIVDNDANCAAYTEWKVGAAKGCRNVVVLTLGTGIGGGLIIENKLFRGSSGTGGEIGHYSIHTDGIECNCGSQGCFERYCSASAIEARVPNLTTKELFEHASNPKYRGIIDSFLHDFKVALTSLANIFDPDVIVLVGGVSKGVADYLDEIRQWLKDHAFSAVGAHVRVVLGQHGNLSGAVGAALIAADEFWCNGSCNPTVVLEP